MTDRELDRRAAHRLAVIRHAQEVTVEEGVETEGERRALMGLGVMRGQGWLLGRPQLAPVAVQPRVRPAGERKVGSPKKTTSRPDVDIDRPSPAAPRLSKREPQLEGPVAAGLPHSPASGRQS